MGIEKARSPLTPTAMEKVSETIEIDSKPNNKVKVSTGINLPMTGSSQSWMDTFEITDKKDSDDEEEPIPSVKENNLLVSEYVKKESEKKAIINLPMTEASDAWMDDFEALASDSDDEQEQEEKLQEKENVLDTQMTKCTKPEAETKAN